jgi:hypothetical protein
MAFPIMLTFDDTDLPQFTIAKPEMEKYGFKGLFFIMTVSLGKAHYMSREQVHALSEDGKIEGVLEKNGLKLVSKDRVACPFLYAGLDDGIKSFMGTGPAAAAMNNSTEEVVEETIAKSLQLFLVADDFYFLSVNKHSCMVVFTKKRPSRYTMNGRKGGKRS